MNAIHQGGSDKVYH